MDAWETIILRWSQQKREKEKYKPIYQPENSWQILYRTHQIPPMALA